MIFSYYHAADANGIIELCVHKLQPALIGGRLDRLAPKQSTLRATAHTFKTPGPICMIFDAISSWTHRITAY